jgi:hypothetical protein
MLQLDHESADLIAANAVQQVLALYPSCLATTVESTLRELIDAHKLDDRTASYVVRNSHRFCLLPAPRYFDAKWHAEAERLSESMNPFGTRTAGTNEL